MALKYSTLSLDKIRAHAATELAQCVTFFERCPHGDSYKELQQAMNVYQNAQLNSTKGDPGSGMEMSYHEFVEKTVERYVETTSCK